MFFERSCKSYPTYLLLHSLTHPTMPCKPTLPATRTDDDNKSFERSLAFNMIYILLFTPSHTLHSLTHPTLPHTPYTPSHTLHSLTHPTLPHTPNISLFLPNFEGEGGGIFMVSDACTRVDIEAPRWGYWTALHCTVTVLCCAVLYCTVLCCAVLLLYILCSAVPYRTFCTARSVVYCTVLCSAVNERSALHCTAVHCTVLYCTVLYHTVL
jgi:hypothetical protein